MLPLAAAVALRWLLDPLMGDTLPLVTLFGAVAVAVWIGGPGPAIAGTLLGYVACSYLFIQPRGSLSLADPANLVGLLAYLFTCTLVIGFGQAARVAQRRADERGEVLRVTLHSIGDAVITTDLAGRVTYLNDVAAALTGWSLDAAQGQALDRVFLIVNEDSRQPVVSPALRALREGVVVGLANHTLLIDKAGNEHPIDDSAAPIRDEQGNVSGCVLIFRDVTQQRQLQREKSRQLLAARMLASIVESSEDAIVSKSLDGIVQSWNAAAERLFGHSAAEAIGQHISLVIPADRIAEEDHIIASIRAGRRIEHFETERVRRNGERIHVSLTISPIKDDSGEIVGASKIVRDITARKLAQAERERMTDELRNLAQELRDADRRKNEFLATLAHELRNPLAPLRNMLEVLKRSDGDATKLAAGARDDGAAAGTAGAARRRSARSEPHHARQAGAAHGSTSSWRRVIQHAVGGIAAAGRCGGTRSRSCSLPAHRSVCTPTRRASRRFSATCSTTPASTRRPAAQSG